MSNRTYQTTLLIRGDHKNAVRSVSLTRQELDKLLKTQKTGNTISQRAAAAFDRTNKSVARATRSFHGLGAIIGVLGLGKLVSETVQAADTYASLQGQLKLVTDSQEELSVVYARNLALANETGQSTEATVNLYARMARSTEELNVSQDDLLAVTKAVNQSFVVSGATQQEAASTALQLSQGLAAGALRGEELNSVMENSPRLARALADGLRVNIGELREMGKAGELTSEQVFNALLTMSGGIESEFESMPETIGRAMQRLRNDTNEALRGVDTGPLIEGIDQFREIIEDPSFQSGVTSLATGLLSLATGATKASVGFSNFAKFLGEEFSRRINGVAQDDMPGLTAQLDRLNEKLRKTERLGFLTADIQEKLKIKIAEAKKEILDAEAANSEYASSQENLNKNTQAVAISVDKAAIMVEKLRKRHDESTVSFAKGHDVLDGLVGKTDQYIEALEFEIEVLGLAAREQAIALAVRKADINALPEQIARVRELAGVQYDLSLAQKEAAETAKEVAKEVDPWAKSLENAAERIDAAFADAWNGSFASFSEFADGLKDAFKTLLAELAHQALTKPILLSIGGALGVGGLSGGGASGGGGLLDTLGSNVQNLFSGLGGLSKGAAGLFESLGFDSLAQSASNQYVALNTNTLGGNLLNTGLSAGAGIAGGFVGNELGSAIFGKEANSNIGSTVGGAIGTAIGGPVGAFIGSALGGAVDSLFGGSGKTPDQTARAQLDLATGNLTTLGRDPNDEKFSQENFDAVQQTAAIFSQFSDILGGSSANLDILQGDRRGVRLNGRQFSDMSAAVAEGLDLIVASATDLDPVLKSILQGFNSSTAQDMLLFSTAIVSISDASGVNTAAQAVADYAAAQEAASLTTLEAYQSQTASLGAMIDSFDGSSIAADQLNMALQSNKTAAYAFAIAIQEIGDRISAQSEVTAQYFREAVMTEEELRQARRQERNELKQELKGLTDPEEIAETAARLLELEKQIFDSLSEEIQLERVDTFATFTEQVNNIAQRQLDKAEESLVSTQDDINARIQTMLEGTAARQQEAANTMYDASLGFGQWVQQLQSRGITVNLRAPTSEVNL